MLDDINRRLVNAFSDVRSVKFILLEDYIVSSGAVSGVMESLAKSNLLVTYRRLISNKEVLRRLISMVRSDTLRRHFENIFLSGMIA